MKEVVSVSRHVYANYTVLCVILHKITVIRIERHCITLMKIELLQSKKGAHLVLDC